MRHMIQEQGVVFDPETVELIADAYRAACQTLGLKLNFPLSKSSSD